LWPAKLLVLLGFFMLFLQGVSEIIKQIAVMRGDIPEPAEASAHAPASHES
jgi:TRAP-type mannitol/chloroaromatic compound transport system permease small subunit